jgi:hypothetical protein
MAEIVTTFTELRATALISRMLDQATVLGASPPSYRDVIVEAGLMPASTPAWVRRVYFDLRSGRSRA